MNINNPVERNWRTQLKPNTQTQSWAVTLFSMSTATQFVLLAKCSWKQCFKLVQNSQKSRLAEGCKLIIRLVVELKLGPQKEKSNSTWNQDLQKFTTTPITLDYPVRWVQYVTNAIFHGRKVNQRFFSFFFFFFLASHNMTLLYATIYSFSDIPLLTGSTSSNVWWALFIGWSPLTVSKRDLLLW